MKHRNLLLAVCLTAAPLGAAQAADVVVYGRAHVSLDWLDNGAEAGGNFASNSSRIGFKAAHTLESGLKVMAQVEQEVRYDQPGSTLSSRDTFVGLEGRHGLIRFGYMDTPLKVLRDNVDPFGDRIGDARNMVRLQELGADFDMRFRNGIHYRTPEMKGLRVDLHYSVDNMPRDREESHAASSGSLSWRGEGSYLALAYELQDETAFSATRLAGYRDFGQLRISGLLQHADVGYSVDSAGLAARYQVGKLAWKGQVYTLHSARDDADGSMLAAGVDYQLDPALTVYAMLAHTSNEDNANFRVTRGGHGVNPATVMGEPASGLSVGLIYNF